MDKEIIEIFTDGACQGNPGPGGWGAILRYKNHEKELSGSDPDTTNNRMELLAAIKGLEAVTKNIPIHLYTDSQYLEKGMTLWIEKWKKKKWHGIKNPDLWQQLDALSSQHRIKWRWIRGHDGHVENERADQLARNALKKSLD